MPLNDSISDCKSEAPLIAGHGLTRFEHLSRPVQNKLFQLCAHQLSTHQHGRITAHLLIPLLLALVTLAAGAAAVWQWQRIDYHAQLAQVATAQRLQPYSLNQSRNTQPGLATVTGQWLPNSTVYISPRMVDGKMGALVLTVLRYQDASGAQQHLAVQRGWAQQSQPNQMPALADLPAGTVKLKGELSASVPKAFELKAVTPQALGIWQNYDSLVHAKLVNQQLALPILVLTSDSPDSENTTLRRNSTEQTVLALQQKANSNRGYALQWLLLCLVGLCGLGWMWRTQRFKATAQK